MSLLNNLLCVVTSIQELDDAQPRGCTPAQIESHAAGLRTLAHGGRTDIADAIRAGLQSGLLVSRKRRIFVNAGHETEMVLQAGPAEQEREKTQRGKGQRERKGTRKGGMKMEGNDVDGDEIVATELRQEVAKDGKERKGGKKAAAEDTVKREARKTSKEDEGALVEESVNTVQDASWEKQEDARLWQRRDLDAEKAVSQWVAASSSFCEKAVEERAEFQQKAVEERAESEQKAVRKGDTFYFKKAAKRSATELDLVSAMKRIKLSTEPEVGRGMALRSRRIVTSVKQSTVVAGKAEGRRGGGAKVRKSPARELSRVCRLTSSKKQQDALPALAQALPTLAALPALAQALPALPTALVARVRKLPMDADAARANRVVGLAKLVTKLSRIVDRKPSPAPARLTAVVPEVARRMSVTSVETHAYLPGSCDFLEQLWLSPEERAKFDRHGESVLRRKEDAVERRKEDAVERRKEDAVERQKEDAVVWNKEDTVERRKEDTVERRKEDAVERRKEDAVERRKKDAVERRKEDAVERQKEDAVVRNKEDSVEREKEDAVDELDENDDESPEGNEDGKCYYDFYS